MWKNLGRALRKRATAFAQWLWLGALVGTACGALSAAFLFLLDRATEARHACTLLVFALPVAGLIIGFVYEKWGASIRDGNSLVIDTVHGAGPQLPLRMAPMVLVGTVLTHLFGGSAGREGTAVQMGASVADAIAHRLKVTRETRLRLLAAGMAGGFGSVFGTPIAGTVFGLEVLVIGRIEYDALAPALVASLVGDYVTRSLGVVHTHYPHVPETPLTPQVALCLMVFAVAMAIAAIVFIDATHGAKKLLSKRIPSLPWRMAFSGLVLVVLWKVVGTNDYLGLGVPTIVRAFDDPTLPRAAFAWKLVFTVVTLGGGFLGGEVTPLFFVGATLGSVLARMFGLPLELGAAVGLGAVFGAAANTPLALSIMTVELCGASVLPHVAIVTAVAYLLSGHRGLYVAQRLVRSKRGGPPFAEPIALRDWPHGRVTERARQSDGVQRRESVPDAR